MKGVIRIIGIVSFLQVWQLARSEEQLVGLKNDSQLSEPAHAGLGKKICMDELGCFVLDGDFFHILYRPINVLPESRDKIQTRFYLFTRENPSERHILRANHQETVDSSTFDPSRDTKIILHGLLDSQLFGRWMEDMKNSFLVKLDCNVIIVDWSKGNHFPYTQATANTRVVGAELALLLSYLMKTKGLKPEKVHIIGHSLGAHVAGYAGKRMKEDNVLIGRITALDPAEPYFQNMPVKVRIDRTDADFVDIIHSDTEPIIMLGLGMRQSVGHLDFFPNDGKEHPGCNKNVGEIFVVEGPGEAVRRLISCEHQRSVDFFHASIGLNDCTMIGYRCPNWDIFQQGKCIDCGPKGDRCAPLGLRADEFKPFKQEGQSINMYLRTGDTKPFCVYGYQVVIHLANPKGSKEVKGALTMTLHGNANEHQELLNKKEESFFPGSQITYLITTPKKLGIIDKVSIEWKASGSIINIFKKPTLYIKMIRVTPIHITDKAERTKATSWMCGTFSDALTGKEKLILRNDITCKKGKANPN